MLDIGSTLQGVQQLIVTGYIVVNDFINWSLFGSSIFF